MIVIPAILLENSYSGNMKTRYILGILFIALFTRSYSQVTVSGAASGNTTYSTLKAAFTAINGASQTGRTINITITASTTETSTATLNAGTWTMMYIYPTTAGLSISGNLAGFPLIDFNGADNVAIDGRVNQSGSTPSLTIRNTSNSSTANTSTIRYINDATQATVRYCNLQGAALNTVTTAGGIVLFSTTTGTTGNDYNTVTYCNITNSSGNRPKTPICSIGTSSKENNYNHITYNNFYDLLTLGSEAAYDIQIYSNSFGFNIANNSFYETSNLVPTSNQPVTFINVNTGDGHTISNNYIGGTSANCGGTAMTKTNAYSNNFTGIYLNGGVLTTNNIQGNTIKNISWNSATTFYGININAGLASIGTSAGNTIGASTSTGSLTVTSGTFYGIFGGNSGSCIPTISNNIIGSVTQSGSFYGIKVADGDNITVSNNTIGSTTTAGSITLSAPTDVYGISCESISANTIGTLSGNTVANLAVTATGTVNSLFGIYVKDEIGTISGNRIYNISSASSAITNKLVGLKYYGSNTYSDWRVIASNTVYNLSESSASFTGTICGIYYDYVSNTRSSVERNFIYNLSTTASSASIYIYGIYLAPGYVKANNNVITLSPTNSGVIAGIYDNSYADWCYYNTVYLGGSPSSANADSYAYVNVYLTGTKNIRNNIFFNARSNTGSASGKHYAISISTTTALTTDYNDYYVTGTNGVLGRIVSTDYTSLALLRTGTGQDLNSVSTNPTFGNPGGTIAYDYMAGVTLTAVDIPTGLDAVTIDYTGASRVVPVTMGAFEGYPYIASFTPTAAGTGATVTISGDGFNGTTQVTFGAALASSFTVVNQTTINAVVGGGNSGSVIVTNAQGEGGLAGFTYLTAPTTQAYNVSFSSTTNTQTTVGWINGNGSSRAVFIKATSTGTAAPVNGTAYTANTVFGSGTQIGSTLWYCIYNGTGTSVTVTGLTAGTTYRVMVCEYNGGTGAQLYYTSTATNNPNNVTTAAPTISVSGGFSAFTACYGNASTPQQVQVSGSYLSANITVTAPSGFEVSTSSGSNYAGSLTLTQSGGNVASTNVYCRLKSSNAVGSYSGNITFASTGATTQNSAVSGTVNSSLASVSVSPATAQTVCGNSYWSTSGTELTVTETGSSITSRYWGKRSVSGGTITPIPGEVMTTFTPTMYNLEEGNWYVVCVSTPTCGATTVSNEVYISIHLKPTVDYISGQTYAYIDGTSTLSCSTAGGVWSSLTPSVATINQSGLVTAVSAGNTEIQYTVTVNGCSNYSNTWFSVIKYDQTISFTLDSPVELGVEPITLNGTATSGLPVSYTSSDLNVATIEGNVLTVVGAGYTTITAFQPGNEFYNEAPVVQRGLEVTQKTPQTITFTLASPQQINAGTFGLNGWASSSLDVSYTSSNTNVATVSGSSITIVGMGYTTITASQAGNWQYAPAPDVTQELIVCDVITTWIGGASSNPNSWDIAENWSDGEVPGEYEWVSIPAFPIHQPHITAPPETPTNAYYVKIYPNASLTVDPGAALNLTWMIDNQAGPGGLVIDSDSTGTGSLITDNTNVTATIKRYITGSSDLEAMAYHMVSVPLAPDNVSLSALFLGSYLYEFNTGEDNWIGMDSSTTNILDETRGYMIYSPESSHTYSFEGTLNSGYFGVTATYGGNGNNLVPNPYPSAIDWDSPGIEKYGIANSIYLWPAGGYNYISYVDGIVIPEDTPNPGIIPVGQSFFVKATDWPYLAFNNSVKVHNSRSFQKSTAATQDLLRIKANANGKSDETVIRFCESATVNADNELDAWKYTGLSSAPQLFSLSADSKKLSINSLPYNEDAYLVTMGFSLDSDAEVKLNFGNLESFDPRINIHLLDTKTAHSVNLRTHQEYSFNYIKEEDANRFKLQFAGPLGKEEIESTNTKMWFSGQTLYISAPGLTGEVSSLRVWNSAGQEIINKELTLNSLTSLEINYSGPVVAVLSQGNTVVTTKGVLIK
jgi:hypothetical protein